MDYVHCPKCRNAYNVATHMGCPNCVVEAAPIAAKAEGSGPINVPNRFRMAAAGNGPASTAIIAADPIADVVAAASLLVRAAARVTPRQVIGAVLTLVSRAPRFLRS